MESECECGAKIVPEEDSRLYAKDCRMWDCGLRVYKDGTVDDSRAVRHWRRLALIAREALLLDMIRVPEVDGEIMDGILLNGTSADWKALVYAVAERRVLDVLNGRTDEEMAR